MLWGNEVVVCEPFSEGVTVSATERTLVFDIPMSPGETNERYSQYSVSTQMLMRQLDPQRRDVLIKELIAHWTNRNRGGATHTIVASD
jgi:hypothetical protein